ncbi:MAG: DUF2283 domain-containing protein [Candidatus Nitrosocosmicus sp.]|nr:DUF2283 domain-containing protein [Candidatus Nitrosocosmicus sp.]MDN5867567.1 DUF2283 domain-containing protein [Candidatus Nitrosocosmicus sp.]
MNFTYDKEVNALYIKLSDKMIIDTITLGNDVFLDIDSDNKAVGIEFLLSNELDARTLGVLQNSQMDNM